MRSKSVLQFCVAFFLLVISLTLQSLANASLFLTPKHDHHHNHHSCHVNQHKKECIFKSIALPIDQFNDASINQVFTLTQHVPSINQTGFSWINWQGEKGLLPVLSELAQNNPSQSYHNPFDQKDKTPNVNDWMYSASLSDIENIDVALKFKLFHQKKEVWVPLWKAQSTLQEQEEWGWNKIVGWVSNVTCKIGLGHCEDRLVYQIGGYAVIDIIDVGFTYQNNKKIPWIKVVFKGFKHCFNTPPDATDIDVVTNEDQAVAVQLKGSDADNNPLSYTVSTPPKHGKLEGSVPNLSYIPDPNFVGQDEFFYTVNDGSESTTAKVTITVKPVNDAPIAQNQQLTVAEDHPLNLVLTGTDIDSPNLSYAIESQPLHGKVVQVGGQYQYIPDPDYVGEDSFRFSVSDGELSASGLIQITVTPVNDAPVAQAFDIETAEDTTVEIQLKGTDPDNDILTYTITNRPQHGILVGFGQNLQYIPHPNYFGKDEFTYTVNDGQLTSTAIVKINVLPVNDMPVAPDIELTVNEDGEVKLPLPELDVDGEPVKYEFDDPRNQIDDFIWISNSGEGTISKINVDSGVELARYRTGPTTAGNPSRIAVDLDGHAWVGNRANNTITKIGLKEKGQCIDRNHNGVIDTSTGSQDIKAWGGYFGDGQGVNNASDECILLHVQVQKQNIATPTDIRMVAVDKDNNVIVGGTNIRSVFKINGQTGEVIKGLNTAGSFYGGFVDQYGRTWAISRYSGRGVIIRVDAAFEQSELVDLGQDLYGIALDKEGIVWADSLSSPAIVAYDPKNPSQTKIFYQQNRSGSCYAQGMVLNTSGDIYIAGCLNSNVVGHYKKQIKADGSFDLKFIANYVVGAGPTGVAIDKNGAVWASNYYGNSVSRIQFNAAGSTQIQSFPVGVNPYNYSDMTGYFLKSYTSKLIGGIEGTLPNFVYKPALDFNGTETIYYKAYDHATGQYVSGKIIIRVTPVNDAPIVEDSSYSLNEDASVGFDLLGTDKETSTDQLVFKITQQPTSGTLEGSGRRWTYKPNPDFNGTDSIQYTVSDGQETSVGTISFNVAAVNDSPVAQALNISVDEDQFVAIKLQGTDVDGDTLSYSIIRPPASGVVTGQGQDYVYTPNANFSGTDTFEYAVSDGKLVHKAIVTIVVRPVNDAPVANNQEIEVRKNKTGSIVLTATDVDSANLTYQLSSAPSHGTITGTAPNFVYTPATGYVGADEFQFTVSDGTSVGTGRVQIQVVDTPNRLPEWQSVPPTQAEVGTLYQYSLQATDPDQDPIAYHLAANAPQGMSLNGNVVSWTPQEGQEGNVEFQVVATDTENGSTVQTVKLTVQARNVAPVIHSKPSYSTTAAKPYKYQLVADDANQDKLTYSLDHAPVGMKINAETGLLTWEQAVEGQYNIVVKVSDGRWIVSQSYTLTVTPPQPLSVEIVVPDQIKLNEAFSIKAQVGGSSSNTTVQLWVDGVEVALDNNYQTTLTLSQSGQHTVTVIAKDGTETQTKTINIWVTDTSDTTAPQVTLNGLDNLATITKPTSIMGQISDQNLSHWTVSLYDVDGEGRSVWTKEGQGNINGELAVIDPTLLVNGVYTVVVRVVDIGGNVTEVVRDIIIDGKMKVGELAFTLEDAVIPMPGLDISLQRSYDSRLGHRVGDFGHAWSLGIQQMQMRQSRPIHTGWETYMKSILLQTSGTQLGTICLRQRNSRPLPTVTVTLPNGDVETFQVELGCASGLRDRNTGEIIQGNSFPVTFKPVGDTQSRFNITGETTVSVINGRWSSSSVQEIDDNGNVDYLWYIPSEFSITTQDQVSYYFSKTQGITKIVEPTGNTLTINRNGIFHSTGTAIQFVRDSSGRITTTTLPDNTTWKYEYDSAGDLVKAIAPNGVENLYVYNGQHRLLKITDKDSNLLAGYEYDADGRLIAMLDSKGQRIELTHQLEQSTEQVKDRLGRVTTYTYDDYGNITKEVDALGHITTRTFNDRYDQLSETDALGHTITWTYDDKHNKLTETNHLGQMTSYSYDSNGKMLTETDHTGRIVSDNRYDSSGQLTELKNAAGQTTSMSYGSSGLTGLTDVAGHTTSYVYTGDNLTETTDPTGRKTRYSYDANKRKLSETVIYIDGSGAERQLQTRFEYDSKGRLVKQIDADGGISTKTYGIADELLSETNRFGQTTTYQYDVNKKLIQTTYADGTSSKTVYDAEEQVLQETDRLGRVTQYQYDLAGRKTKTTFANGAVLTTQYDAVGNILSETNALGQSTRYEYDGLNRKVKTTDSLGNVYTTSYDELGRVSKETDALGQITQHQYNALNQRTKTTYANGNSIQTEYNTLGQKIAVTDELSRRTQYQYDLGGRLIQVTDPMGQSTRYSYDNAGHKLSQTDALGRVTRWEYDALGREIKRILPLGQSSSQSYDSNGLLSQSTDFNGQVTRYSYDSNQRLKQKSFADGETESYSYDVEGQLLQSQQRKADGTTSTSYQYDAMGNLLQENRSTGDILSYGYDLAGNKLFVKAKNGQHEKITTYQYDALNRLISTTDHLGTTSYNYNAVGNRLNEVKPNGIITGYAYDERNRLTAIAHAKAGQVIASYAYVLDAAGQRLSMIEHTGRSTIWSYDAAGRLLEENIQNGQNPQSTQYQYDAVGNRIEQTVNNIKTTYQYDGNDRLITEDKAGSLTEYSYDPQGNLLSETKQGQTTSYQYNAENELTQTQQAGQQIQYNYDFNGIRTEQDNNGFKTHYLNDHNMPYASVLMELQNQQPTATYTYGDDLISYHQGTGSQYYLYDALGSTRGLTNENGQMTDSYNYDAFGANTEHQGSSNNKYQYAGEQKDSTGNYYLRARYYNPNIGRFTQMDSYMGQSNNPITLHKYLYANANPVMYTDPSGYMFSLSGVMSGISMQAGLATMRYGAVSIGRTMLGGLTKPLLGSSAMSHVSGAALAGLVYNTAINYCQKNEDCKPQIPIIFYGLEHYALTSHISDAQFGDGSNSSPISALLKRQYKPHERGWLSTKLVKDICPSPRPESKQCDEYPFASAQQGGESNYLLGEVSLKLIDGSTNESGGRLLGRMYRKDGTSHGDNYLVLASNLYPISFYITRKGKFGR
ncbi:Ig-like domain-containing protein [Acinetobacter sp. ANC5681]|uniref:tandem-95 repeat protein n=1 Tax=Acinetobacter sp. ANC5681 TaxID=2929504 RepID=UPI00201A52A5|nr:Ig-like domain-containing protein [Acinetobacter sp. ANC5681]MCL5768198.1 Ig-like domain-containing protein [Acinetobacter sp. ANC5681]